MNLSKRLTAITEMVTPCAVAADIGCDHGFTSISLVESNKVKKVYACDINEGPLIRAKEHVKEHGLEYEIEVLLGNGLKALKDREADCIIIAGMGGLLMKEILFSEKEKVSRAKELLLSPHTDVSEIRHALFELSFEIEDERMIYEDDKYYTIIRAVKKEHVTKLSELEEMYGPVLIKEMPEAFLNFLQHEKEKKLEIIQELQKNGTTDGAKKKLSALLHEITKIDFILKN